MMTFSLSGYTLELSLFRTGFLRTVVSNSGGLDWHWMALFFLIMTCKFWTRVLMAVGKLANRLMHVCSNERIPDDPEQKISVRARGSAGCGGVLIF